MIVQRLHPNHCVQIAEDLLLKAIPVSGHKGASRLYLYGPGGYQEIEMRPGRCADLQGYGKVNATATGGGEVTVHFRVAKSVKLRQGVDRADFGEVVSGWREHERVFMGVEVVA